MVFYGFGKKKKTISKKNSPKCEKYFKKQPSVDAMLTQHKNLHKRTQKKRK